MSDIADQAIAAIGLDKPGGFRLSAREHARSLPASAGALQRVLERPEISALVDRHETADRAATRAQKSYRRLSRLAFAARFLSITVGAAALLQPVGGLPQWLGNLGMGVQYTLLTLSFLAMLLLAATTPFEKWMQERARAENARVSLFNRVTEAAEDPRAGELSLLPLQLEYFRRYQLDVQRNFYRLRGMQHAHAAGQTMAWRWFTVALVALAATPAGLGLLAMWAPAYLPEVLLGVAGLARAEFARISLLILGIFTSALADLLAALSLVNLNQRNASRYMANADNLDFLRDKYLQDARVAAAAGNRDQVADFIALVQVYISSEHREWVLARDLASNLTLENFAQLSLPGRRR